MHTSPPTLAVPNRQSLSVSFHALPRPPSLPHVTPAPVTANSQPTPITVSAPSALFPVRASTMLPVPALPLPVTVFVRYTPALPLPVVFSAPGAQLPVPPLPLPVSVLSYAPALPLPVPALGPVPVPGL
jgi:hypothetical protein